VAAATVLYVVLWAALALPLRSTNPAENAVFLVPALAIVLAARGASPARRVGAAALALVGFVAIEAVFSGLWMRSYAPGTASLPLDLDAARLTGLYQAFLLLYPLAVVAVFAAGAPERLIGGSRRSYGPEDQPSR
jgi:hypothetical protein